MNGHILSAPTLVRIPYGAGRTVQVVASNDNAPAIPPDSYAYIYEGNTQSIGTYQDAGNGTAVASIMLTNDNETDRAITVNDLVYSFWNGDIADDDTPITIIYEPRRRGQMV